MARIHRPLPHGREGNKPKRIIIHAMGERIIVSGKGTFDAWDFMSQSKELIGGRVSAHSLIYPVGTNCRCRNDNQIAWHASGFNTDTLGIEFLVPGDHDYDSFLEAIKHPYLADEAYAEGLYQVREWLDLYPITEVARHSDKSPGRKADPGDGFPWEDFKHDLGL